MGRRNWKTKKKENVKLFTYQQVRFLCPMHDLCVMNQVEVQFTLCILCGECGVCLVFVCVGGKTLGVPDKIDWKELWGEKEVLSRMKLTKAN